MTPLGDGPTRAPAGHGAASGDDATRWAALARRIAEGDAAAEEEFAAHFIPRVRVLASARLHGSDAALDIAQETVLAALKALRGGTFHDPDKLPAYVLGIVRNLLNNHFRRSAASRELLEDPPEAADGPDPQQIGLDQEQQSLVRHALLGLNRVDRRIVLLTLLEGMRPREIAPLVGLKAEAVRTRKARAVKAVADEIERLTRNGPPSHIGTSGRKP